MSAQTIDPKLIRPNPFQPRLAMNPAKLAELAESIKAHGLQQPPVVRKNGHGYELAFGHRRFEAWKLAKPGEPFPCDLQDLTDQQMGERAATENGQREDLNPIERALGIKLLIDKFGLSQVEAGRFYGLTSQGAVSNVLGLLKHAPEIQALVSTGALTERQARDLRLVDRLSRQQAVKIAQAAAKEDERERSEFINEEISRCLGKLGRRLYDAPFNLTWPKEPIAVDKPNTVKGEPGELRACAGCRFFYQLNRIELCGNPSCYDLKVKAGLAATLAARSKALGIPVAGAGEKIVVVHDGNNLVDGFGSYWEVRPKLQKLVNQKLECLRLIPLKARSYDTPQLTGSAWIGLATTNAAEVKRLVAAGAISAEMKAAKKKATAKLSPAELARQKAREAKEMEARRAARAEFNRAKADTLWLLEHCAQLIADRVTIAGGVLDLALEAVRRTHDLAADWAETRGLFEERSKSKSESDRQMALVLRVLASTVFTGYSLKQEEAYDWPRAQRLVEAEAVKTFRVQLPAGWNKPPIHRTEGNCWHCGRFGVQPSRLTRTELAAGWDVTMQATKVTDIECPGCRRPKFDEVLSGKKKPKSSAELLARDDALAAKKGKRLTEVFAQ